MQPKQAHRLRKRNLQRRKEFQGRRRRRRIKRGRRGAGVGGECVRKRELKKERRRERAREAEVVVERRSKKGACQVTGLWMGGRRTPKKKKVPKE
jgi:hypothetical protein